MRTFTKIAACGFLIGFISCGQNTEKKAPPSTVIEIEKKTSSNDTLNTYLNEMMKNEASISNIETSSIELKNFIPDGFSALDATSGDLNLDTYLDMILVLKKNGEDSTSDVINHPEKRPLLILIGQPNKTFKLAAKNDNTVYCIDCGGMMGDPFTGISIKKGYFSVEHYGGSAERWTRIITYKYSPEDTNWYLYKDGRESFNSLEPEKTETKTLTAKNFGKIPFDKFDIYKNFLGY